VRDPPPVDRLFYLIAMAFLGLVALEAVSTVKDLSDGDDWQAGFGLVILIVASPSSSSSSGCSGSAPRA
jgi:hypothetical protein